MTRWFALAGLALTWGRAHAEIVDRIAVVVDRTAIKQSDIAKEIRLTAFINSEKPDLSLAERKKTIGRLIEQTIIRKEIGMGRYPAPDSARVNQLFQQVRQRYRSDAAFQQALESYGISQDQLMEYLRWQQTVLQFVALRFGNTGASGDSNQSFFNWLDETRRQTPVLFKEEDLQ
jgi:N-acetyl-anhydromuramyl-L-alanine amidase AmpD